MNAAADQLPLVDSRPYPGVVINARCQFMDADGVRAVVIAGVPVYRYAVDDVDAEDVFIAQALLNGYAKAHELAEALGRSLRTVHRARERYVEGGAAGVARKKRGRKTGSSTLGAARETAIREGHAEGKSGLAIGNELGVAASTVLAAMRRMGLEPHRAHQNRGQLELLPAAPVEDSSAVEPQPEAAAVEDAAALPVAASAAMTLDLDATDRAVDRLRARRGELDDAVPLFAPGDEIANAGVLLAVPMLVRSGVFDEAKAVYGSLGPGFYGLRTIVMTVLMLALLRIKRPENLKEYSPAALGRLLGLDRAPEVKTLRRKLALLADDGRAEPFLERLVKRRVEVRSEALGFLYVDGHVRVYHGQVDLPKTHVARLRLSLPATQDVWVNDADGHPLMFITQEAHPQLVGALPPILESLRKELGERRVTVVFDRGGWSPKLFRWMDAHGFDVLTYRKGDSEPVPEADFRPVERATPHGPITYDLHDTTVTLERGFTMRQVTRLQAGHQTKVMTTRLDLPAVEVAWRMFDRWRQENFFKYMREQYAIDALVEHGVDLANPMREVPNPARKALDRQLREARKAVAKLEAQYGAAAMDNEESRRRTMRGFKIAHGTEIGIPLREARSKVARLLEERRAIPQRVPIGQARGDALKLPAERKRLSDGLKMLAYQVETDLVRAVAPHYKRSLDEGRRLVCAALRSAADLRMADGELRVTLAAQSSPHRTRAIAKLCDVLNETATPFPGTNLRLRYAVRGAADCAT